MSAVLSPKLMTTQQKKGGERKTWKLEEFETLRFGHDPILPAAPPVGWGRRAAGRRGPCHLRHGVQRRASGAVRASG